MAIKFLKQYHSDTVTEKLNCFKLVDWLELAGESVNVSQNKPVT